MSDQGLPLEYHVVCAATTEWLVIEVTRLIGEGWRPQGGIASSANTYTNRDWGGVITDFSVHQAMVR
jgi:hypothetical protein